MSGTVRRELLPLPGLTSGAAPVYFQTVLLNQKAVPGCDLLLQPFDPGIFKLDDRPADRADEMIMVLFVAATLVTGLLVAKVPLRCQPALGEELESAMDRGVTDAGILVANSPVELLRREVRSRRQEGIKDHFPLPGRLEAVLAKIFTKGIFVGHCQPLVEIEFQFKRDTDTCQEIFYFDNNKKTYPLTGMRR